MAPGCLAHDSGLIWVPAHTHLSFHVVSRQEYGVYKAQWVSLTNISFRLTHKYPYLICPTVHNYALSTDPTTGSNSTFRSSSRG